MILQDDWHARGKRGERQHIPRKAKTVHVKYLWGQTVEQFAEDGVLPGGRRSRAERQKVVAHAVAHQLLRMSARLDNRHANTGSADGLGDIDESRPRIQELRR